VTPDRSLSAALVFIANDLDGRQYPYAGAVRRAARQLALLEAQAGGNLPTCPSCGAEVLRAARGRPRIYCSARCRHRARSSA
jgi:hypothetical protein